MIQEINIDKFEDEMKYFTQEHKIINQGIQKYQTESSSSNLKKLVDDMSSRITKVKNRIRDNHKKFVHR